MKKRLHTLVLLVAFSTLTICCKKKNKEQIPLVPVNISIYISDPQYFNISIDSGWEYITGGSRGILVYRLNRDNFIAYERHCPYKPNDECGRIEVDSSNVTVFDPCCGSKFLITDGSILNGPAGSPLKQYQTSYDGTLLKIYN